MRVAIFLFLLVFLTLNANASRPIGWPKKVENIHYEYVGTFDTRQELAKREILLELTSRFCKKQSFSHPILIQVERFYDIADTIPAFIRVDSFLWLEDKMNYKHGLVIQINTHSLDVLKSFSLISSAILNYHKIPKKRSKTDRHRVQGTDLVLSTISDSTIRQYQYNIPNESLACLSTPININPWNRNELEYDCHCSLGFYYQNKQYHFYSSWLDTTRALKYKAPDSLVITSSPKLHEIIEGEYYNVIFTAPAKLYVIEKYGDNKPFGPYEIDSVDPHRYFVASYYEEMDAFPFAVLFVTLPGYNRVQKVLIVPKYDLVISDYQKKELQIINEILNARNDKLRGKNKNTLNWTIPMLLLSALLAAFVLSLTWGKWSVD